MQIIENSLFFSLICRFINWLAEKYKQSAFHNIVVLSFLVPVWRFIDRKWDESFIMRLLRLLGKAFSKSACFKFFTQPSRLDAKVHESVILSAALKVINSPAALMRKIYSAKPSWFDNSAVLRACDHLPLFALCVLTLVMFITPQSAWNNMYSLLVTIAALALFWVSGARNENRRLSLKNVGVWPVFFFLVVIIGAFISDYFSLSYRYLFFYLTCFILLITLVSLIENENQLFAVIACVVVGLIISSGAAIVQRVVGVEADAILTDLSANEGMPGRVYSFFENPNSYANILVVFAPMMLAMGLDGKKPARSLVFLAAFLLSCLALIMTYSRGGWVSLAFSIFVMILIVKPSYAPFLIVLGCLALPMLPDTILNRLLTIFTGDTSIGTRRYIYEGTMGAIASAPITGVGLGPEMVGIAAVESGRFAIYEQLPYTHAHNIYLEIWAELGIIGLASYVLAVFFSIQRACRAYRKSTKISTAQRICVGGASGYIGLMLFGLIDFPWSYPRVMVICWLAFAIICAAAKLCEKENMNKEI